MWAAIRGRWQWRYDCTTGLCWREDSWHTDGKDLNSVACCVCYFIYCFAVIWSDELSSVPSTLFKKKKDWKVSDSSKLQKRRIGAGGGFGSAHIGDKPTFSYRRQLDFSGKIFCCSLLITESSNKGQRKTAKLWGIHFTHRGRHQNWTGEIIDV